MSAPLRDPRLDEFMGHPWSREVLVDEDGGYLASVPELPGCFADGATLEEALANLDDVLEDWLAVAIESDDEIPPPRRVEHISYSGRFSVRVPKSLHRLLAERASAEGCSLNQLVTMALSASAGGPRGSMATSGEDAYEDVAAAAARRGAQSVGALKGIAKFLRSRGEVNLSCLLYRLAADRVREVDGVEAASVELGMAAALARREGRLQLAEVLWRESLSLDPTNTRSASALGQLLHHQGRYEEAVSYLEPAERIDNYARLFLGWSRLFLALDAEDDAMAREAGGLLADALRHWAHGNHNPSERAAWERHLERLQALGPRFADLAAQLVEFANTRAAWGRMESAPRTIPVHTTPDPTTASTGRRSPG